MTTNRPYDVDLDGGYDYDLDTTESDLQLLDERVRHHTRIKTVAASPLASTRWYARSTPAVSSSLV